MATGLGLSNTFNPGISAAQARGTTITANVYPDGEAGIRRSVDVIAQKIRQGALDPLVVGWGDARLREAGIDGRDLPNEYDKASALLEAFRERTVYRQDPPGTEWIQSATTTLCLGPGLCITGGDCDDMVVALGSVFLAQSIPTQVVKQSFGADAQQHVLLGFESNGTWYYADPSTRQPITTRSQAVEEVWFDPMDHNGATGVGGTAEIVTLGRVPAALLGLGAVSIPLDANITPASAVAPAAGPTIAGPYAQSQQDLNNEVSAVVAAGDTYLASNEFANAVQAYMAAGQAGVTNVGPEIDLAGSPNNTAPWTHRAWVINAALQTQGQAAINAGTASAPALPPDDGSATGTPAATGRPSAEDAAVAQAQAKQIAQFYQQAILAGAAHPTTNQGPGAHPLTQSSTPYWILGGLAVVGGLAWGVARAKKGGRRR